MKKAKILLIFLAICLCTTFALSACGGKATYKITFIVDGVQYEVVTVKQGEQVALPQDPAKEGFNFAGWYYGDDIGFLFTGEGVTGNITVYAKWTEVSTEPFEYIVNFDSNGGRTNNLCFGRNIHLPHRPRKG